MLITSLNHVKAKANEMILIGAIRPLLFNHSELLIHLSVPLLSISPFLQDSLFFKAAPLLGCSSAFLFFALFLFTLNTCNRNTRTFLNNNNKILATFSRVDDSKHNGSKF